MSRTPRNHTPSAAEPLHIPDAFANSFEVQDFEDWLRIVGTIETGEHAGGDGRRAMRWKTVALVLPRSSLHGLIMELRQSAGGTRNSQRRHN